MIEIVQTGNMTTKETCKTAMEHGKDDRGREILLENYSTIVENSMENSWYRLELFVVLTSPWVTLQCVDPIIRLFFRHLEHQPVLHPHLELFPVCCTHSCYLCFHSA